MGHRKHSAPRRGSLAFLPRSRAQTLVPTVRTWPTVSGEKPTLLGYAAFKVGTLYVITVDDREKTPNFGKPLFNASTLLAVAPVFVCGLRAYTKVGGGFSVLGEAFAKTVPRDLERKLRIKPKTPEQALNALERRLPKVVKFVALVSVRPRDAGLSQRKPYLFEIEVGGGDPRTQFEFLKSLLGKEVPIPEQLKPGSYVDVIAVTKGKGFEGPVTRHGVKRKQHKSRKSVRAVGVLGPWHPSTIMYTVPRAGQRGFHQRVEYNKRILALGNATDAPIHPPAGFPHFGVPRGEYLLLRGSVPGPAKRLVRIRLPLRPPKPKVQPPKILQISSTIATRRPA